MTDLEEHIWTTPLVDTHEHQRTEQEYLQTPVDVLVELFDNYVRTPKPKRFCRRCCASNR